MQTAAVLVVKSCLASHKDFPQRPFFLFASHVRLSQNLSCPSRSPLWFRVSLRICHGGLAHPGTVLPGAHPGRKAFPVARPVATDHLPEFLPIDRTTIVVAAGLIPLQIRVR